MRNQVFVINGQAGVGKNTFVDFCAEILKLRDIHTNDISSVDKVKEAGSILGWNGEKDELGRQFLSNLKDMSTEFCDGPFKYMEEYIVEVDDDEVTFLHIREPEEIKKVVDKYPHVVTVVIKSTRMLDTFDNHADSNVSNYEYDYTVNNDVGLKEFNKSAEFFVKHIIMGDE